MNKPTCACFEYVGDNPYCPVHGKSSAEAPKGTEELGKEMLVVRRSSSAGKVIVTLGDSDLVVEDE